MKRDDLKAVYRPSVLKASLALAAMSLIWGYNWVVMKEALRYSGPFDFSFFRIFFGAMVLFGVLVWKKRPLRPRQAGMTFLLGLFTTSGAVGISTWALVNGGAGKTAILVYTMPFWLILIARPVLAEKIRGVQWAAVAVAVAGLALVMGQWSRPAELFSVFLAVAAGISWAVSAVITKIMYRREDPDLVSVTAWQMLFGVIPIALAALMLDSTPIQWTPFYWGALAYNIVLTNAVAVLLWFYSLQALPAGMAGMGTLATPVIGIVSASIRLGERPSSSETAGMLLILGALALITIPEIVRYRRVRVLLNESRKALSVRREE